MTKKNFDHSLNRYLYRGVGGIAAEEDLIIKSLTPKAPGKFSYFFKFDGTILLDGSATLGESEQNATLRHQLNQDGFPTSGVSTTPHKDRSFFYACGPNGCHKEGIILTIDRLRLSQCGVSEAVVSASVYSPSVPEDDEVILFDNSDDALPRQIVVKIERVTVK
jgi:hypothetical protein